MGTIQFYEDFQISILSVEEDNSSVWRRILFTASTDVSFTCTISTSCKCILFMIAFITSFLGRHI